MELALIHANGEKILVSISPEEFKARLTTEMKKSLPLVVATRGEIIKAWERAFDQVTTEFKQVESIRV